MAERQFSVRVSPGRWEGELEALARRLANVTGMEAGPIEQALRRGPMTVDADLRRDEAEQLMERLSRASIPSDVVREGAADKVVARGEPADRSDADIRDSESESVDAGDEVSDDDQSPRWSLDDETVEPEIEEGYSPPGDAVDPPSLTDLADDDESSGFERPEPESVDLDETAESENDAEPEAFDGDQLAEALSSDEDRRPYEPEGYDDRTPHLPLLAAALSLLAPGAGQTYNGDANEGARYAFRALLLYPWFNSVREAWRRAIEIREYRAPYPPEGSIKRAFAHLGAMWAVVATVVIGGWIGVQTWEAGNFERDEVQRQERVADAISEAKFQVRTAKVQTWGALDRAGPGERDFTIDRKERAQRLFRIGLEHCRARDFDMCEATMRRVASLDTELRGQAIRLQVWANAQKNIADTEPLPDIGIDETLREYDRRQLGGPDAGAPPTP